MKRIFVFIFLLFAGTLQLHAQRELLNPLINSKEVIKNGVALHDAGKYKAAITEYLKVPQSDTGYAEVLHELMLSYYNDSNFVEAEKYGNLALEIYPERSAEWYNFLADVYDDTKRTDLALKAYDTILAQNPYNYLAYFNKGITLYRQSRYDEATADFQHCIMINPFYTSAHYFLGQLQLIKGNMVAAMLSFATNLLISPGNRYQKASLNHLITIAEVNTTATEYLQKYKPGKLDNFEETQEILVSKAALDNKYKLKADLEDQVVRQLQVVMEKLEYNASDKGFWMQYYVPLFKNLWDNGQFEPLIFQMFGELDVKKIKEYTKKEKKKIDALTDAASVYLSSLRESQELVFNKRATAPVRYYIKNYLVNGKGAYGKNVKNEEIVTGPWEFYYTNGRVKSKGNFDSEGLRTGEWHYYYENGILKEISNYVNDKANGKSQAWFDNGLRSSNATYADDKLDGVAANYFYGGRLSSVINYKAGKKNGLAKYYHIDGYLSTVASFSGDQQEGEETLYYPDGKITSSSKYVKDMPAGEYKAYFNNGKLKISGNYLEGKKIGTWNNYIVDGSLEQVENYANGELEGEKISYYSNGKEASSRSFRKGDIDGKKEDFDEDGIIFSETIFEKGRLRDIKFFDKKGVVISNTTSRKGNAGMPFYGADGAMVSMGYYSKEGLAEGEFTGYYKNGRVYADGFYKNGFQDGKKILYYTNGKLMQEGSYTADKPNGYFVNYYNNGQVSDEGWYVNGERQGTHISYNLLGKLTSKLYYLDDKIHGVSEYCTPSGKLDYKQYFDNGWINRIEQYDSNGKLAIKSVLPQGQGKAVFTHFNGNPYFESNYKYYKLDGMYAVNNGDGTKASLFCYKNGALDSSYIAWHPNGKIQMEGQYSNGGKTGTWKYYYYNGQLAEIEMYTDGKLNGTDIQYDESGAKDKEYTYKDGMLEDEMKMYGDNSQLMLVLYYRHDYLKGYSYEDKAGNLLPMIPLEKGSGNVKSYYRNGVKSAHMVFNAGLVEGDRILYSTNGKEQAVSNRVNGLENGAKKIYYPNGKIMLEENYYYGERHGPFKYYSESGTLIYELNFYLDTLHGECKYYTAGKPAQSYTYYYGLLEAKK